MENRESRRVWELGSPLISHTKSMSKYEDMQDYNTRTIGMSEWSYSYIWVIIILINNSYKLKSDM